MLVNKLTMRFLDDVAKRRSENTHKFYEGRLVAFERRFGKRQVRSLKKKEIEKYIKDVNHWPDKTQKAPDTQRANITAFEQIQKFAIKNGLLTKPILDDIEKPAGRNRERLPNAQEVEQIKSHSSVEFQLVYEALRRCGARPNEIARATVANWDRVEDQIILKEHKTARKTGQPRRIAVGEVLKELIHTSLNGRTEGPLFLTPRGKQWTTETLSAAFRRARNHLGLDKQIVLYTARHEHGTAVYESFGELAAAVALGHKGTGMIAKYAKIKNEKRRSNQDAIWAPKPDVEPNP